MTQRQSVPPQRIRRGLRVSLLLLVGLAMLSPGLLDGQEATPVPGQRCRQSDVASRKLSRGDAARESMRQEMEGAMRDVIRRHVADSGAEPLRGLVVVESRRPREELNVVLHDTALPDSLVHSLLAEGRAQLARWPGSAPLFSLIRLDSIALPDPEGGRRMICEPFFVNRTEIARTLEAFASANPRALLPGRARSRVVLLLAIDRTGTVAYSRIVESSGLASLDGWARIITRELRIAPAIMDGVPVDLWVQIPFAVADPDPAPTDDPSEYPLRRRGG